MASMGEWQTDAFRQSMVKKLDEAIREHNVSDRNGISMENQIFQRSKSRDEYLNFVAKCILMISGKNSMQTSRPGGPDQGMNQQNSGQDFQSMNNGGGGGQGMMPQHPVPQGHLQQQLQGGANPGMQQQIRLQQQQQIMMQQQQMGMQMRPGMQMANQGGVSQLQQRLTQGMPTSMGSMPPRPGMMTQMAGMPGQSRGGMPPMGMQQGAMQPTSQMGMGGMMGARGPPPMYMNAPSPNLMIGPNTSAGYSPASQQQPSPAGGNPRSMAPSPLNSNVNTPQNDQPGSQEDQQYLEKVRQLGKYIEPLRKMIARIGNDDQEKLGKMKKLLDILSNPTKRMPIETLLKCEAVLERMNLDTEPTPAGPTDPNSANVNPLLGAIVDIIKAPKTHAVPLNHTLHRTFGGPTEALFGTDITLPPLPKRKRPEPEPDDIPDVLQREVALLPRHFKVTLDPSQPVRLNTIQLICQLEDRDLPAVPPMLVTMPQNYPDSPPVYETELSDYGSTPFFERVQQSFTSRMNKMPTRHSLTQLLTAWEYSVRGACSHRNNREM